MWIVFGINPGQRKLPVYPELFRKKQTEKKQNNYTFLFQKEYVFPQIQEIT